MPFGEGVGLGGGSGSGTGVAVALGDGVGEGVGLTVGVGLACSCPGAYCPFSSDSLCCVGWPLTKDNDKTPVETQNNRTAAAMTTRVFILFLTSLLPDNFSRAIKMPLLSDYSICSRRTTPYLERFKAGDKK